jgi:hypothetical protein
MKVVNKNILGSFYSLSENFSQWIIENMCFHWFDDNTERKLLNKVRELASNKDYFMFRYDDEYSFKRNDLNPLYPSIGEWNPLLLEIKYPFFAGSKQRIENIINNFNERSSLRNNKFKVYSVKEDKEVNSRVTIQLGKKK